MGSVEPANSADIAAVLDLASAYQAFYAVEGIDRVTTESMLRRFLAPSADGVLLVARDGDRVVGYACVHWRLDTLEARTVGHLHDLYVLEEERQHGYGHELIKNAADECRRHGAPAMTWMTAPDNSTARRIYDGTPAVSSEWIEYELRL